MVQVKAYYKTQKLLQKVGPVLTNDLLFANAGSV